LLLRRPSPERGPVHWFETPDIPMPFAGLLGSSWPVKFEGQFNYRDESKMNACRAAVAAKSQKRWFDGG
jgi:hypothetical protein